MRISDWSSDVCSSDLFSVMGLSVFFHASHVDHLGFTLLFDELCAAEGEGMLHLRDMTAEIGLDRRYMQDLGIVDVRYDANVLVRRFVAADDIGFTDEAISRVEACRLVPGFCHHHPRAPYDSP